ncbi:LOW QUALITY PROTEIN: hypothetical protein HZS_7025 [Henneguya salminicola]|nr:LOW QUALITY PROTEIN: hypothetical protein HZS_7025 [Henneguya salminicola]
MFWEIRSNADNNYVGFWINLGIIRKFILPGTGIITDDWDSKKIDRWGHTYEIIIHAHNFLNHQNDTIYTKNMEKFDGFFEGILHLKQNHLI